MGGVMTAVLCMVEHRLFYPLAARGWQALPGPGISPDPQIIRGQVCYEGKKF